ncbi:MAG: hypothetical protein ACOZB3_11205 [Calditrichota bacterium]
MYARMGWLAMVLAVVAGLVIVGCEEEESEPRRYNCSGSLQLWLPNDTLFYMLGDSAIIEGFAVVKSAEGNVVPGVAVSFSLVEPFGSIIFVDRVLGDTTNEYGRVYFQFASYHQNATQTIIAEAPCPPPYFGHSYSTICDSFTIVVQSEQAPRLYSSITIEPDTLFLGPGLPDSALVTVLFDGSRYGIPGITIIPLFTGGILTPATCDLENCYRYWLHCHLPGTYCGHIRPFSDSNSVACVFVDSLR